MADSIIKKMKGLFMSKEKKKTANKGGADADAGFEVLNDAQAPNADEITDAFDTLHTSEEKTLTEAAVASDGISENPAEIKPDSEEELVKIPEPSPRAEKTHEKVARIAAEMNTKGYGL